MQLNIYQKPTLLRVDEISRLEDHSLASEPCLHSLVKYYYVKGGFSLTEAVELADKYFSALEKLSKD